MVVHFMPARTFNDPVLLKSTAKASVEARPIQSGTSDMLS
jgi:hypothetical protein